MTPPRLADVNVPVIQANKWQKLQKLANVNQTLTPVEIKGYYVIGLIDDICQSVQCLVKANKAWPEKYLPAYSLFASAVDLLGRCITGNKKPSLDENLRVGFWYLFHPTSTPPQKSLNPAKVTAVLVTTPHLSYTVEDLISLRHYSSHGQATVKNKLSGIDSHLLEQFPRPIGDAIETYWTALHNDVIYCQRLGEALIDPYDNRADPLIKTIEYFAQGQAAGSLFYRLDWEVDF